MGTPADMTMDAVVALTNFLSATARFGRRWYGFRADRVPAIRLSGSQRGSEGASDASEIGVWRCVLDRSGRALARVGVAVVRLLQPWVDRPAMNELRSPDEWRAASPPARPLRAFVARGGGKGRLPAHGAPRCG